MEGASGLNHGGYMSEYGQITGHQFQVNRDLCEHDPQGCDPVMLDHVHRTAAAFAQLRIASICIDCNGGPSFPCMMVEPHISWRHLENPGPISYSDFFVGAAVFGDPTSTRLAELFREHGVLARAQKYANASDCGRNSNLFNMLTHYEMDPTRPLVFASLYSMLLARPLAQPLPMERTESSFAWADPVSSTVVVKHAQLRFYASMMWRSYTVPPDGATSCSASVACTPILSNVSRIHYWVEGDMFERVATIPTVASAGQDSLYTLEYGDFAIAICGYRCVGTSFQPSRTFVGAACTDLVSGRRYEVLPSTIAMAPMETLVLVLDGLPEGFSFV